MMINDNYSRDHRLYFAYGSDMHPEQIEKRCITPEFVAVAKLENHRVSFFGHSYVWDGGLETIVKSCGDNLWGVLYKLDFGDALQLDSFLDVRLDGTGPYFHSPVKVEDVHGNIYYAITYKKNMLGAFMPPSKGYMDYITEGGRANGLPDDYVERLRGIEVKKAKYHVPMGSVAQRTGCSGCDDLLEGH